MDSRHDDRALPRPGCPIRRSPDQHLLSGSPELIAASHVLHRLLAPRHSPCALSSLTMFATGRPHVVGVRTQRLGELPRACSRTDGYPSRLSKNDSRGALASRSGSTPRSPLGFRRNRSGHRASASMMELMGIEPTTSGLQNRRSPSLSYSPEGWGVAEAVSPNGERAGLRSRPWGLSSLPSHVRLRPGAGPVVLVRMLSSSGFEASL